MKKVKLILGAIALLMATLTMSFSRAKNDVKSPYVVNDCWTSIQRYQADLPPDMSTDQCFELNIGCCFKPDPNNPSQFLLFGRN